MSDSTQFDFEDKEPNRQNRFILALLAVLLVGLGFGIWRFTRGSGKPAAAPADTAASQPKAVPAPVPAPRDTAPAPSAASSAPAKKPHQIEIDSTGPLDPVEQAPPSFSSIKRPVEKPMATQPASRPSASVPQPSALAPSASVPPAPKPAASGVAKTFAPEDQAVPASPSLSEDGQLAMNNLPKALEPAQEEAPPLYKQGMDAYHRQDYAGAVRLLGQLPVPATRQRGNAGRDAYVEGRYVMGVSLMKENRVEDAEKAFLEALGYDKYDPRVSANLGICYVELKQYSKANKAFEAVVRDQGYIDPAIYDDLMQRTKYYWALAWTRMSKTAADPDRQAYYQQQALLKWKDYQTWFGKDSRYTAESRRADDYIKSLSPL